MKNKKILIGAIATIVAIILLIAGICINIDKSKNRISISSPELARMMNYEQFEEGDEAIDGTDNVKFSAFFLRDLDGDGYAEKIKGTCKEIGAEDTMYMEINVQTEGYLKDAKIEIAGKNFYLQTALPKDEQLKDNYIGNNIKTIEFNQMNNGTQKLLTGIVRSGDYSYASSQTSAIGNNINNYSREDNKIILTGTYVAEDGTETAIIKEIPLTIDWYGKTKTEISSTSQTYYDLPSRIDEENGTLKLNFEVKTKETEGKLNLSKNHVEGTIPELNGYAATEVKMTNATSDNLTFAYDETTKTFIIDKVATVSDDGTITTTISRSNTYNLEVLYPIEAYKLIGEDTVSIKIPVKTYYEGYNNQNSEFTNPYKSNTASDTVVVTYEKPQGSVANFDITVGKNIYNPSSRYIVSKEKPLKIYNGISEKETEDTYIVRWNAYTGTDGASTGLVMKETKNGEAQVTDKFIKTDATEEGMENITSNIGIYVTGADNLLKEDGWIKVYDDETDNFLVTFTKENWNTYTSNNPYQYELPVKHIRIETSETNKESSLYVYNIKELDDEYITENHTQEEFENLKYIKSTLSGYLGGNYIETETHQANYEAPYSVATIEISNDKISTQVTEEHDKITITASNDISSNQVGWGDGSFLVKLPEEILEVDINSVEINNSAVTVTTYEVIENEQGKFIKINTKNSNDTAQSYTITIDTNITPDPRLASSTKTIELYAANNESVEYYYEGQDIYDVNDNLNTNEMINKTTTSISLVAPGSLLTNQTASEYDSKNSVVVSPQIADITPLYAKVDNEKQTAKIGMQLKNNYISTISEVIMLGKIPFEGNTTVLSGKDLKSEFTTKMIDTGIEIPEGLQGKVTIYYSENETPDKDLAKAENGWTLGENVTNWDNIKTFLIDFEDEVIAQGAEYTFYYKVEIPEGTEFNKTTYSHHGIYFSLDTVEGKYRTQTEPNKLGLRIAEKYNLEIIKTQTGKDKKVLGATYSVKEILEDGTIGATKTGVTNENGTIRLNNLYAEKIYEIQEIKSPNDYELNSDIIRFTSHVSEDGTLTVEKIQGTTKEDIVVTKNEGEKHKVTVKVEDEAKAKLKITKKEQGTDTVIKGVKYKLTGEGLPSKGRILTTNENGEVITKGLKINEEYTLEEIRAEGYYLSEEPVRFKIVNNEGAYELQITEGTVLSNTLAEENSLPIASLTLENEKIPTYILEISKIKKILETELTDTETEGNTAEEQEITYLEGAKFRLYKDEKIIGTYTTDENGKITINDLYQYIEGKDEEATYTLKEVLAPLGYAKVKDITFKVQNTDGTLQFINTEGEEEKYTVEGTTVKLTIEDSPSFKLIKKDAETGETLANVKFAIYNIDEGNAPARNSKGEILGNLETIDGEQYYTVTTDENGQITADLTEGFYKAVEVQAPEKYDIENKEYYFGIGGGREGNSGNIPEWSKEIGGGYSDSIRSVVDTRDGGYIVGGSFSSTIDLGNGVTLTSNGSSDGMLIKYNSSGEVEWAKAIGGSDNDYIDSVSETSDGGYIVSGSFSSTIDLGNGVTLTSNGSWDGMLIKYNANGEVEWARSEGGRGFDSVPTVFETSDGSFIMRVYTMMSDPPKLIKYSSVGEVIWAKVIGTGEHDQVWSVAETRDGGYIVSGSFSSTIDLGNGVTISGSGIIKYSAEGEVEWAKSTGGGNLLIETRDGGYIVSGRFSSTIDLGNGVTLTNNGSLDGMLIKYNSSGEVEWGKAIGGSDNDYIDSVFETSDGGYIVRGSFRSTIDLGNGVTLTNNGSSDGMLIKYNSSGEVEWAKAIGGSDYDYIDSVSETSDGGYIVSGSFSSTIDLGNGVTISGSGIIKYCADGEIEWAMAILSGLSGMSEDICEVVEMADGGYIVTGYFYGTIDLGNGVTLTDNGNSNGMLIKYSADWEVEWAKALGGSYYDTWISVWKTSDGGFIVSEDFYEEDGGVRIIKYGQGEIEPQIPETQELIVENERKQFRITTDVNEIDGIKGGNILGEDEEAFEVVKYGDSNTKEIIMTPDENYEIMKITLNGEEHIFTPNEDGSYSMPILENITEDTHIEVSYALKDNKITINKVDSETKVGLEGATFKLDQIEEREVPESTIGELTNNGQEYIELDLEKEVTDALGELTDNGQEYTGLEEVTGVLGSLTNNGTYYFVEQDGKYVPTNSKTYRGGSGAGGSTANSYIPIDLANKEGEYTVVVNANCSSESNYDFGYATITEITTAPTYNNSTGRFMYISGTVSAQEYTSMTLQGGKTYYLHLGYRKDGSVDTGTDQIIFNSIKVYQVNRVDYEFIENEGKYESNNQGQASTVANSYIPIDLTNKEGTYAVVVNANISSESGCDIGYATITEDTTRPAYNSSTGRFIYISGPYKYVTTPDYTTVLEGGKIYYLHLGYYKNASTNTGEDKFTVNSVKLYETKTVTYGFVENEGKYESTIQGKDNRTANSYIPIDLTNCEGKYNLIVNANISSEGTCDIGYATITEDIERVAYNSSTGRFIYISGTSESVTTPTDYTTVLEGGKIYYLHLGYYKNASTSTGDDKFTINSVRVTPNPDDLYHTEVTSNSAGQAITQIPFGKYAITETVAPEGYELNENSIIVEFTADGNHEFTIENNKLAKVRVHHYLKDTTTKVAEDDLLQDKAGYPYTAVPKLDLEEYELEKDEDGNYIIPENATGQFISGEQEVIYYYVEKEIPLIVNHYIEGTETSVSLISGGKVESSISYGNASDEYTTEPISPEELSKEYELVEVPSNSTGTYNGNVVEVTYYYKKVVRGVTINKYQEDGVTPLEGAKFTIEDTTGTGVQEYTTNSKGKIETTLEAGDYIITEVEAPEGYQLPDNPSQEIIVSKDIEEISLDITNTRQQGKVIVHHYIENSTESVLLADGRKAEDVIKTGNVGDIYATTAANIASKYELVGEPSNSSGNITEEQIVVTYYYRLKDASVVVHHYKEGTEETVSADVTIEGQVDDEYTTSVATDILSKYEVVEMPTNANGIMTGEQIIVTYYYRLKDTSVLVHHYKEGTEEPVSSDVTIDGQVDDKYTTSVAADIPSKYELVEMPTNANGIMTEEQIVVTYYYRLKDTSVLVHHYKEGTEEALSQDVTINGKVDDEYTTQVANDILDVYELVEEPANKAGIMTEEQIVVTYYYRLRTANISASKTQEVSTGKNFVISGDKITYTIEINNGGNLGKDVVVKENIPTGTTFIEGSIKIDGVVQDAMTSEDLSNGITINVPMAENGIASVRTLSFDVTVNEGTIGDITNTAIVDEENTNEVKVPIVTYEKVETITRKEVESTLGEKEVTAGDNINYVIKVHNTGSTKVEEIQVKDTTPTGTTIKAIGNEGVQEAEEIIWTIAEIEANDTAEVGFTVEVQYSKEEYTIKNTATVEGKETNETENLYKKPGAKVEISVEKKGTDKVASRDMKVYYEVNFTAKVEDFKGKAKVTLVDTLPYSIDENKSNIANGQYDAKTNTITWVEEITDIDTFALGAEREISITKILEVSYNYKNTTGSMENKVDAKIELQEPKTNNPAEYDEPIVTKESTSTKVTQIEIPANVIVHHYMYDEVKNEYTTIKLAEDVTLNGIVEGEYKTVPSPEVPANYVPVSETPEKYEGKMTEEVIEVTYYYQLITPTVENNMNKTATASKEDANKVAVLTKEDGIVTYGIKYNVTIKDYIGKADIEIVDTLPAEINTEKSDLVGGIYDRETNTITWTETLEGIDTFANGTFSKDITKQIKVVYKNQDVTDYLINTVEGKVKVYYPENHSSKPGEEQVANTARDEEKVAQEYKVTLMVEKDWEDNDNLKGKRPESVTIVISGIPNQEPVEKILSAENEWKCEITDLPKYDAKGNKMVYEVTEKETEVGDLEYYELPVVMNVEGQTEEVTQYIYLVKNSYKLLNTELKAEITKTGSEEIKLPDQEVEYTINFKAEVIEYIGGGKIRIVDTLPYKIDEEKSDLANGTYDDLWQTITWVEELPHINTEISGENYKAEITKQIKVVYKDIDLYAEKMQNKVYGKVELYESEVKDEKETTYDTKINVDGKVIVKYIDIDTGEHIDKNYTYEIVSKIGRDYTAEKKEIENYEYVGSTKNETGIITEELQEVIYYYTRIKTSVLVKYQDTEGNELATDVLINGQVLDKYKTEAKDIENYRVVNPPENKEGIMTIEPITVIYVYEKIPTKVTVKYIYKDIETGEEKELLPAEIIEGLAGDEYITERKVITNYRATEPEPTNKTGKMTPDPIEVIYYYEKIPSGVITVKYVDIETEEEITYKAETEKLTYREEIKGFIGDEYKTEEKEIPYYVFVKNTENATGILTENADTVTYYYRKQIVDFSVEKTIKEISLNGNNVRVPNNKLAKIEVRKQEIEDTEIVITYEIAVKNEGEIKGTATITEVVPEGYEVIEKEERWQENEGVLEAEVELDVGEKEELTIKQKWVSGSENLGDKTNNVQISKIKNEPNFEDTTVVNNISSAGIIVSVNSGGKSDNSLQIMLPIILLTSVYAASVLIITIKKERLKNK